MNEKGKQGGISKSEGVLQKKQKNEGGAEEREQKRESMVFGKTFGRVSRVQTSKRCRASLIYHRGHLNQPKPICAAQGDPLGEEISVFMCMCMYMHECMCKTWRDRVFLFFDKSSSVPL